MFVDGLAQLVMSGIVVKMVFHQTIRSRDATGPEVRRAAVRVTMPTTAALQFAKNILAIAKKSESKLIHSVEVTQKTRLLTLLAGVDDSEPDGLQQTSEGEEG